MVEDFQHRWNDERNVNEAQRYTNQIEAAQRGEGNYRMPSKPPSQAWDRLHAIARFVVPAIAIAGLLSMVGFAVWVAVSAG